MDPERISGWESGVSKANVQGEALQLRIVLENKKSAPAYLRRPFHDDRSKMLTSASGHPNLNFRASGKGQKLRSAPPIIFDPQARPAISMNSKCKSF